jgi:penicillin-insensitive murein endopeptidase
VRRGRQRPGPGRRRTQALLAAPLAVGCFGTPTPLSPGLAGSVGLPHHGVQTGAIELPESGIGFARYRNQGGYHWGQPALVNGLCEAARRVELTLPGGAPLMVGDLSARYGGKIARHHSHRSGRDVDLLWYVTRPDGTSIQNSSFVHLAHDGTGRIPGRGEVRLDVPRQWQLIKALLSSDLLMVQWLYSSNHVESIIIGHAIAQGEDHELIWQAQNVMLEPLDSLPHDDHLHLRIACPADARVHGCEGGGPYWSWLDPSTELDPDADVAVELLGEGGG